MPTLSHTRTLVVAALAAAALAASSATATAGTLYTNAYSSQQLVGLSIDSGGLLSPLPGSPFAVGHFPDGIAVTPDGRFLIASFTFGTDDLLIAYPLAPDGTVSAAVGTASANVAGPPAITPAGDFVYVPGSPGGLLAFRLGTDGSLTLVGGPYGSADGELPAVTPDGRFVFLPGFSAGEVERFAVQPDGSLVSLGSTPVGVPGSLYARITPDGKYAVVMSNDAGNGDIRTFAIGTDGSLTPTGSSLPTADPVTALPVLSPNGRYYYLPNANDESVSAYAIDAAGALSEIGPPVPAGVEGPRSAGMSADGRYLYVEQQSGEEMQAFSVGSDGAVTKIGTPTPLGGEADGSTPIPRPATPTARFTVKARAPGKKTAFDATASFDLGAALTTYSWNFGDGRSLAGADPSPTHTYAKAGVYDVTLTVSGDAGCTTLLYTGQTAFCNPEAASMTLAVDTPPALSMLKVTDKRFAVASISKVKAPRRGTTFRYALSEPATVEFAIQRKRNGRRVGKTCRPKTKGNAGKRRCALYRTIGSFSANGKAGKNATRFSGKVKKRKLRPGSYRAVAVATDKAGGESIARKASFKVVKPFPRKTR